MAQQTINTTDTLNQARIKINANDTELYSLVGAMSVTGVMPLRASGTTVSISGITGIGNAGQILRVASGKMEWTDQYSATAPLSISNDVISIDSSVYTYSGTSPIDVTNNVVSIDSSVYTYTGRTPIYVSGLETQLIGISGFGTSGQVLKVNNTEDGLEWATDVNYAAAGSNSYVQFNDNTSFGASEMLTFNNVSGMLYVASGLSIGTTNTTFPLQITRNANEEWYVRLTNTSDGDTALCGFQFLNDVGAGGFWLSSSNTYDTPANGQQNNILTFEAGTAVSGLTFKTNATTAPMRFVTGNWNPLTNTRLFIDYDGDIGIGNTTPSEKLSVTGNVLVSGLIGIGRSPTTQLDVYTTGGTDATMTFEAAAANTFLILDSDTTGKLPWIMFKDANTLSAGIFIDRNTSPIYLTQNDFIIENRAPGKSIGFVTSSGSPTVKAVIDQTGNVGIGHTTVTSKLQVNGPIASAITTKTNDYTYNNADSTILLDGASNAVVGTLPDAATCVGRVYTTKAINVTNQVSLNTTNAQTIDGDTSYYFGTRYDTLVVQSDGSNWMIIGEKRYDKLNRILL